MVMKRSPDTNGLNPVYSVLCHVSTPFSLPVASISRKMSRNDEVGSCRLPLYRWVDEVKLLRFNAEIPAHVQHFLTDAMVSAE